MMKHRKFQRWLLVVMACPFLQLLAGVPLPSVCCYGTVKDAYGYPYTQDAEVVLQKDGVEYVRFEIIGELTPGVNYRVELEMDSGGSPYESYAAHVGDVLDALVYYQGALVMSNVLFTVPSAGSSVRMDLQTGTDSDGDGLPDDWEQMLIAQSGGALQSLLDVRPGDDFDGDGSSNRHEFESGTFPFLSYDCFALENARRTAEGRFCFRFLAVDGFTYQVYGASEMTASSWSDLPFATDETLEVAPGYIFGDDSFKTLYVEATNNIAFVKLCIK